MMTTQEFRPIDAKEKSGVQNLQSCNEEITKVITQVNPKDYQCISMGEYIIFQGDYHPDGIVTYKVPRKGTDYEFDKFPEEYQEEVQKLQKNLNLTKKQVNGLYKTVKPLDNQVNSLEKRLEIIRNKASQLKNDENKKKQIDNFFKSLGKFSECLTRELDSYDPKLKIK